MNIKKKSISVLILFFIVVFTVFPWPQKKSPKDLPDTYRQWLEEEVVYIITPREKDVFLQLENNRERDLFIKAFWKQRDPNPHTPENEFKEEHYRRISYANQWFGRESPGPGWRTDMGRIYVVLGEPKSIEKFEGLTEVYPTIIWLYQGMVEYGLPNAFNVVFFKKRGMGEYELYSPIKYGPQQLLIHYMGDPTDYLSAYAELFKIEPSIANVSLSLIPGETSTIQPSLSMASEILLSARIPSAHREKVKDEYAEKLLKYKDIIEVDYTANYIVSDYLIKIIRNSSGIFFVHYLIEPKKLSVEQLEDEFYTYLEINGNISDLKGNTIFQFEKTIPVKLTKEQLDKIKDKLFSFQDMFPLIEGSYKFNLLLKNTVSKEFTSVEKDIIVPKATSLQMSSLLLANRLKRDSEDAGSNKPFLIQDMEFVPSPRNDFSIEDTLYLFFQIYGLDEDLKNNGYLEYSIFKNSEKVHSLIKNVKEYPERINFFEKFSLVNLTPDYYRIKISLFDKNKEEILFEQSNFSITPFASIPRPWILSLSMPSSDHPLYLNTLGNQFFNMKDIQRAKSLLEEAHHKDPNSVKFALDFSRALFAAKEYQRVKQVALPFLKVQEKHKFYGILGQSCQAQGEYEDAILYYKEYLSFYGTNINILNSIGQCYYNLGNYEQALIAWERSLEINPEQEDLQNIVKSLKKKR